MNTSLQLRVRTAMRTLVLLILLGLSAPLFAEPQPLDAFEQNRRLGRGVNIIGYDPVWRSREHARFHEKHFRLLKEAGFQSVRVNLQPFAQMDRDKDWALRPQWLETLDWVVDKATSQGLQVILDFHEFNRMGDNPEGNKERFLAFWRQLADHCQNTPDSVLFEILNEPNKNLTPALWNQYLGEALTLIRKTNPNRTVIVGPAFWNSVDHLKELELPAQDSHLIVTVHYYKPMKFTHQGAAWTNQKDQTGVSWGTDEERQAVVDDFAKVNAWAKEHHRPIFLGEFGAYDKGPMESRARYTAFVARTAEQSGWSWAYWQFDSDFILWDMKADAWVEPILHALIPAQ
ncbi:MAG TPA: glycoside hydrolase family 5 protein [Verrucomicrobiae bacterium]|nr:glycoside hydrolase family 5 protein [Verrucomicrobiae bacterium]